jgi:hypothetical protein
VLPDDVMSDEATGVMLKANQAARQDVFSGEDAPMPADGAVPIASDDEQRQRIVAAITARRRTLMAQEDAPAPVAASLAPIAAAPVLESHTSDTPCIERDRAEHTTAATPPASDAPADESLVAVTEPPSSLTDIAEDAAEHGVSTTDRNVPIADRPGSSAIDPGALGSTPIPDTPSNQRAARLRASRERGLRPPPALVPSAVSVQSVDVPMEVSEPDSAWPAGPHPLGPHDLENLLAQVIASPKINDGQIDQRGVTKNRLAELITQREAAKALAEILVVWFDHADILAAPLKPGRFHQPRPLATTDLSAIAARLKDTPLPDSATVDAAWRRSAVEANVT